MAKKFTLGTSPFDPDSILNQNVIGSTKSVNDKESLIVALKNADMIEWLERFKWNLNGAKGLTQDIIERILYFRFKGAVFKFNNKYYFLPFVLSGDSLDSYGRFNEGIPLLFNGVYNQKKSEYQAFLPTSLSSFKLTFAYEEDETLKNSNKNIGIILTDSSLGLSQEGIPHEQKAMAIIERMVNTLTMIEMNNINGVQTYTLFVSDENQKKAVELELADFDKRILNGKRIAIVVDSELANGLFKEPISAKNITDSARYWQSFTAWNNLRKWLIGLKNGGQHLKQEHATEKETEMSSSGSELILKNSFRMRNDFCELFNYFFDESISIEINEDESSDVTVEQGAQTKQLEGDQE